MLLPCSRGLNEDSLRIYTGNSIVYRNNGHDRLCAVYMFDTAVRIIISRMLHGENDACSMGPPYRLSGSECSLFGAGPCSAREYSFFHGENDAMDDVSQCNQDACYMKRNNVYAHAAGMAPGLYVT
jgi:hypothetical protein